MRWNRSRETKKDSVRREGFEELQVGNEDPAANKAALGNEGHLPRKISSRPNAKRRFMCLAAGRASITRDSEHWLDGYH